MSHEPMLVTILAVPDCPNAAVVAQRIAEAMEDRNAIVQQIEVVSEEQAVGLGMAGSPTVLVDGTPLLDADTPPSMSCRLYSGPDGLPAGAPSVEELRRALAATTRGAERCTAAGHTERLGHRANDGTESRHGSGFRSST